MQVLQDNIKLIFVLDDLVDGGEIFKFGVLHYGYVLILKDLLPRGDFIQLLDHHRFTGGFQFRLEVGACSSFNYLVV